MLSKSEFGFWNLVRVVRLRSLVWPEGTVALIAGLLLGWAMLTGVSPATRLDVAGDYLVMAGVLLGIVFATFAVVTSLLSDNYLVFLRDSDEGVLPFLAPFVVGVGIQILAVVMAIAYQVAAKTSDRLEPWAFMVATILFAYALLDVVSLAKIVIAHAVTRAEYLAVMKKQGAGSTGSSQEPRVTTSSDDYRSSDG